MRSFLLTMLVVVGAMQQLRAAAGAGRDIFAARKRQNSFTDPIYALDDIDAHTVSAGGAASLSEQPAAQRAPQSVASPSSVRPTMAASGVVSSFVAAKKREPSGGELAAGSRANQKRESIFESQARAVGAAANSPTAAAERPEFLATSSGPTPVSLGTASQYSATDPSILQAAAAQKAATAGERHHWSGLENYYELLRQQGQIRQLQRQQQQLQQQRLTGASSNTEEDLALWRLYGQEEQQVSGWQPSPGGGLLRGAPIRPADLYSASIGSMATNNGASRSAFQLPYEPQVYAQVSPGATKGGSASIPQLVLRPSPPASSTAAKEPYASWTLEELARLQQLANEAAIKGHQEQQQQQQKILIQPGGGSFGLSPPGGATYAQASGPTGEQQRHRQQIVLADGRVIGADSPRAAPEFAGLQRDWARLKHMHDTLGPIYNYQQIREQYLENSYCGRRNLIHMKLLAAGNNQTATGFTADQLSVLSQYRIDPSLLVASSASSTPNLSTPMVQLSVGDFPSHMGIYNGTPGESNFLCAASWLHEGFALTLASCVDSLNPSSLIVRFGEWNLNKPNNGSMFTSPVSEITVFPRFGRHNQSNMEHNLALVKFQQPVDFLQVPYGSPACKSTGRANAGLGLASIPSSAVGSRGGGAIKSCWAPVRNITLSEYFDADGEGETRERRTVSMIEVPVKLIPDDVDDAECFRQSNVEHFNFNHPNYICAADYKRAPWRLKLNQTDHFGSGIYCNEAGHLSLVSLLHPIDKAGPSAVGYIDLAYYRPWMRDVIYGTTK